LVEWIFAFETRHIVSRSPITRIALPTRSEKKQILLYYSTLV
jgi:hypothetical protein